MTGVQLAGVTTVAVETVLSITTEEPTVVSIDGPDIMTDRWVMGVNGESTLKYVVSPAMAA